MSITTCGSAVSAHAYAIAGTRPQAPTIFAMSTHIGWMVDRTTGANFCSSASHDYCQSGYSGGGAGGFSYPSSVAVDPRTGDIYVADLANYRVQKFAPDGRFILMFGGDVNRDAKSSPGASRMARDICTAAVRTSCQAGVAMGAVGDLDYPESIAVDDSTGYVYVAERGQRDDRVDKYTPGGRLVWSVGKRVNRTTDGNFCSEAEIERAHVRCGPGDENASASTEAGAFRFTSEAGDLVAVGGPQDLIYVGDEHRVQEFDQNGRFRREIMLASASSAPGSAVSSLAVASNGTVYLVYESRNADTGLSVESDDLVRVFDPRGLQIRQFAVIPRLAGVVLEVDGIAIGPGGELAAIGVEIGSGFHERFGFVYASASGRLIGEFPPPQDNDGLTFDGAGDLYVAATDDQEIVGYVPVPAAEFATNPTPCEPAGPGDRTAAFNCALGLTGGEAESR